MTTRFFFPTGSLQPLTTEDCSLFFLSRSPHAFSHSCPPSYGIGIKNPSIRGDLHIVFHNFQKDAITPISGVAVYFVRPPEISFEFEGGVTGVFDMFAVGPTLESVVRDVLASACVLPNRIAVPVDPLYSMINVA